MLSEQRRQQLDQIVQQMVSNKESDTNIQFVVNDFKSKYQGEKPPEKTLMQKAGDVTNALFGGGKVGEAIGAAQVKSDVRAGKIGTVQPDYAAITPEIRARLEAKGLPTNEQQRRERVAGQVTSPTAGEIGGSVLQSAALFAPVGTIAKGVTGAARAAGMARGASALGKVASGAATGELFDISLNLQEGKTGTDALTPGLGTFVGGALPGVGVAARSAVRFGEKQAPRIIDSLIKPLSKDFSYGKDPGRAVAELGIVAKDFDDLATKIGRARQTTGQEIAALGRKLNTRPVVDIEDALSPLDDAMREAAEQNNSTLLGRLAGVKKALTNKLGPDLDEAGAITIKDLGARKLNGLTFTEARDVLRQVGDNTQFTGSPSDDKLVNSALKAVYGEIKERTLAAADSIDPSLAKDFRKLTERYADLTSAEIATKYRDKIVQRSNLIGLSPQVAGVGTAIITFVGTGGAALPAILAGVAGATLDKLAASPGFKTRLAAILSKKSPEQVSKLFQAFPALQKFFPKGGPVSPGDYVAGTKVGAAIKESLDNAPGLSIRDISREGGKKKDALNNGGKGGASSPTTPSRPSTAGSISTGSAATGKEGVSARKADTSVPFDGQVFYRGEGGTNAAAGKSNVIRGKNFADDEAYAKTFGEAKPYVIKPGAKVLDAGDLRNKKPSEVAKALGVDARYGLPNEVRQQLIDQGYDAVIYTNELTKTGKPFRHVIELTDGTLVSKSYPSKEKTPSPALSPNANTGHPPPINGLSKSISSSPSIPKELEPLAKEARKYGSAEEFVRAQPTLYHGNSTEGAFKLNDQPTFLTADKVQADKFANDVMYGQQRGGIGRVLEFYAKPGNTKTVSIPKNIGYGIDDFVKKQAAAAKKDGYRYVEFTHPVVDMDLGEFPVRVSLYPNEDLLTKAQLTDFYNKVTKKP